MRFAVLGPVRATNDDGEITLSAMPRKLLALLLSRANASISPDALAQAMWPHEAPANAAKTLQIHVHRLRKALGDPDWIDHDDAGYRVHLHQAQFDAQVFAELLDEAQRSRSSDPGTAARLLREALELWRGAPYADIDEAGALRDEIARLNDLGVAARECYAGAKIDCREPTAAIEPLRQAIDTDPYREEPYALLMLAYYGCGRQHDALATYGRIRELLRSELGVDPGPRLRELHRQILNQDSELDVPGYPVPAQLPANTTALTGRDTELAALAKLDTHPETVVVKAIDGMAGVGKTTLAIQLAPRVADQYPDGQLFVDLCGHTRNVPPLDPAVALERMLRAIGVTDIPPTTEERAAAWRGAVAKKRLLILLDNAFDTEQLLPLLPATPGCLVLITSRAKLTTMDNAHPLSLDVLDPTDAVRLFTGIVGPDRVSTADPALLTETVALCGHLPLAIRLAAARFRDRPAWSLKDLTERLRDSGNRMAELTVGKRGVAEALDVSYRQLSDEQQRVFRLLGLFPGADFEIHSVAAIVDRAVSFTKTTLETLVDMRLLESRAAGRYTFHDLVRVYASDAADHQESAESRRAALDRLLEYYLATACAALDIYDPSSHPQHPEVNGTYALPGIDDLAAATVWLNTERANLIAAALRAENELPQYPHRFVCLLFPYLSAQAHHPEAFALYPVGLRTARAVDDPDSEAMVLTYLGGTHYYTGQHRLAREHFQQSLDIFRRLGDRAKQAKVQSNLGMLLSAAGQFTASREMCVEAARLHERVGDRSAQARTLITMVAAEIALEMLPEAEIHGRHAIDLARRNGDRLNQTSAQLHLAWVLRLRGDLDGAGHYHAEALRHSRELGDRKCQYLALAGSAMVLAEQHEEPAALEHLNEALGVARSIGDRNGELESHLGFAHVYDLGHRHHDELRHAHCAVELAADLEQDYDHARAHEAVARAYRGLGRHDMAQAHQERATGIYRQLGVPRS